MTINRAIRIFNSGKLFLRRYNKYDSYDSYIISLFRIITPIH